MQKREIILDGDVGLVPLTQGRIATIDACDVPLVSGLNWVVLAARNTTYAQARLSGGKIVMMHRLLMNAPNGMLVDHKDMNGLNNRRENLRISTRSENAYNQGVVARNTSGFKGVCWHKASGKWMARITSNGIHEYLGLFDTAEKAYDAYCLAARQRHGDFARLT